MPIPAVISDLSPIIGTGPSPNGGQPGGGENPSTFDDYLRAYGAFIAQLRAGSGFAHSGAFRIPFFDASGNWSSSADFVRDASGNVGIGIAPGTWQVSNRVLELGTSSLASYDAATNLQLTLSRNARLDGSFAWRYKNTDSSGASLYLQEGGGHSWSTAPSGTAGAAITFTERMRIDASGNVGIGRSPVGLSTYATLDVFRAQGAAFIAASTNVTAEFSVDDATGLAYVGSRTNHGLSLRTNSVERMRIDASGHQINTPGSTTPPTLTVNGQLNITPTSNTNVRISFRGTDGVTRVGNITLA